MYILGVSISDGTRADILAQVRIFLTEPKFHRIATVNPEFLVLADRDATFKQSLQSADLCVADGFGIVLAAWFRWQKITRYPGADLLHDILALAERDGHSVFLAIKKDGLSSYEEIREVLLKKYPGLSLSGTDTDFGKIGNPPAGEAGWKLEIGNSAIVLCNFGAPTQEFFLESIKNNPGEVRLAMGVGGAFDYLTGKQKRAPWFLRAIGLEWLWRLILQPKRWKRIWNAVVVFLLKLLSKEKY